jgi:hypothetical protein
LFWKWQAQNNTSIIGKVSDGQLISAGRKYFTDIRKKKPQATTDYEVISVSTQVEHLVSF